MKGGCVTRSIKEVLRLLEKTNEDIINDLTAQEEGFQDKIEFDNIYSLNSLINSFIDKYVKTEEEYRAEYEKSTFKFVYYSRNQRIQDIKRDFVRNYIRNIN